MQRTPERLIKLWVPNVRVIRVDSLTPFPAKTAGRGASEGAEGLPPGSLEGARPTGDQAPRARLPGRRALPAALLHPLAHLRDLLVHHGLA